MVHLAIVHAQFEIIHPFLDGNGRLGRILIPLYLYEKGILTRPTFYLSSYLEEHREEYVAKLRALNSSARTWNRWIEFFLRAITSEARVNSERARNILKLYEEIKTRCSQISQSRFVFPLIDYMFSRPIFTTTNVERIPGSPSKPALMSVINTLKKHGIVSTLREGSGSRPQILALHELITICEQRSFPDLSV